jgi:hypothetical protein
MVWYWIVEYVALRKLISPIIQVINMKFLKGVEEKNEKEWN